MAHHIIRHLLKARRKNSMPLRKNILTPLILHGEN